MTKLILLRHGQSRWNQLNVFTGWVDVDLSPQGIEEALKAGDELAKYPINRAFTSTLIRAQNTLTLAMSRHAAQKALIFHHSQGKLKEWGTDHCHVESLNEGIPVEVSWHLNERYYGDLQGMNKDQAREKFGKEQVHIWRRSFDTPPPNGESLQMTMQRSVPYFTSKVLPFLDQQETVLIVAHGNSLRSIVMFLEKLSEDEVLQLEIPTGAPLIYRYENQEFERI